ncbi:MAG: AbrB/MazE/SpoVT family DNA-binding domain-containing protein [Gammaproteobacteria bacterium]
MRVKKTSKNQITLPKIIAETFPGIDYFNIEVENSKIILRPVQPDHIYQVRDKLEELGIAEQDISEAIEWARTH